MFSRKRATLLVAALTVGALSLAACGSSSSSGGSSSSPSTGSGFNAAITSVVNPSTVSGGTLQLGASGDCDSWDPQRTYYAWCWDMQRLMSRSLMAYESKPGSTDVVPDLATAAGTPNSTFTQWTYTMKSGIKFSDGTPVTTADIKYGIERLFATDVINGGPFSYFQCLLSTCTNGTAAYPGPYKDKSTTGLASIQTPSATQIVFTLTKPFTDFNDLMAFPAAAPVEQAKDTGANYQLKPLATGPYMISAYSPGKSVTFVKNPDWDQSTDTVRHPLVNQVDLTIYSDPDAEDARLLAGGLDLEADGGVQQAAQAKIMVAGSQYHANADNPVTGFTRYLVVFPTVAPLSNKDCRLAIFYAINKTTLQLARGGSVTGGDIANTMLPPNFAGHKLDPTYNPYPDGSSNTGDLAMAKTELQKCGQPNGFAINMGYVNQGKGTKVFAATQAALARVGITVTGIASDQSSYYTSFIGSPANVVKQKIGIAIAGWGPDYTSVSSYGFFNSISNGAAILPEGNTNYPSLNDPVVNSLLNKVISLSDVTQVAQASSQLDQQIMTDAVYLPFVFDKTLYYRNPRLTNIYLNAGVGNYYDYVQLGTGGQ